MRFLDKTKIKVSSGNGGKGCISFLREAFRPNGGPDGGEGGKGGDIIFKSSKDLDCLFHFKHKRFYKAEDGQNGRSKLQSGACGKDLVLKVPLGTVLKDSSEHILYDFSQENLSYTILKGGIGGKGNAFFKNQVTQAPYKAQEGQKGEEVFLHLELKLIADVGLLGFPNSGKSSLLQAVSNSKSLVADYPFSTLRPHIGVVKDSIYSSFKMADIPGLIKDAHKGKGLGDEFLSHLERTKMLVHLVDVSSKDFSLIFKNYQQIQEEIKAYDQKNTKKLNKDLCLKKQIVVCNKIDLLTIDEIEEIKKSFMKKKIKNVFFISVKEKKNLDALISEIRKDLNEEK